MKIIARARRATVALVVSCMLLPQGLWAQEAIDESPSEWAMVGDLLVARPLGAVLTVGGTAVWIVSLPFTLLAGNASEAAGTLIGGPVEETFMRCLGCRNAGYTGKDTVANREFDARKQAATESPGTVPKVPQSPNNAMSQY
jgi:hypothetical protein